MCLVSDRHGRTVAVLQEVMCLVSDRRGLTVAVLQEVMYRRVDFIQGPWYDDHFDIPTERQRIGKTLTMIATPPSDLMSRGSLLIGWALFEKTDRVIALMSEWIDDSSLSSVITSSMVCTVYCDSSLSSVITSSMVCTVYCDSSLSSVVTASMVCTEYCDSSLSSVITASMVCTVQWRNQRRVWGVETPSIERKVCIFTA